MCAECLLEFGGTGGEGGVAREVGDAHRESVVYAIRGAQAGGVQCTRERCPQTPVFFRPHQ